VTQADPQAQRIQRLIRLSRFNGYSVACIAGGFAVLSLFGLSLSGVIVGAGLTGCGLLEIKGHRRLAAGEPGARGMMAGSQVLLVLCVLLYCWYRLAVFDPDNPMAILGSMEPQLRELTELAMVPMAELEAQVRMIYLLTYRLVAAVTVVLQGGLAVYYWVRVGQAEAATILPGPGRS
jgi:hypothetical protein